MLIIQNIVTAFEQLWANKLRSLLTVLGVVIAVASTMVVVAIVQGFSDYVSTFLKGLGTNMMWVAPHKLPPHLGGTPRRVEMDLGDLESVEKNCPAVARTAPFISRQVKVGFLNREATAELIGTTDQFQSIRNFFVDVGQCFTPVDVAQQSQTCVLGRDVLDRLAADEGIIDSHVLIMGKRFRVVGLLESKGSFLGSSQDNVILIPHSSALKMFPNARRFLVFMAQAESPEQVAEAKAQITTTLRREHKLGHGQPNDFRIFTQDEILEQFHRMSLVGTTILTGIVGVSLLVGGIGIMNVMLVSVTERTREIGLRKALGARRRDIMAQFLTEAVLLSVAGGVIGIALGFSLTSIASQHPNMVDVSVPAWAAVLGLGFSIVVGVIFGLLPAFKAAILQPIDALRYE